MIIFSKDVQVVFPILDNLIAIITSKTSTPEEIILSHMFLRKLELIEVNVVLLLFWLEDT